MKWIEILHMMNYITVEGLDTTDITGVEIDSRKVKKGDVFVCLKGTQTDGHDYIEQALEKGASAIITERKMKRTSDVPFLLVASTVDALSEISVLIYGNPSEKLTVFGVTGTNGKTSVTHFLNQLYRKKGHKTGVIGTIHIDNDGEIIASENTTPFAHDIQKHLSNMVSNDVSHVFMEVSSHALSMGRVKGCRFTHAAFTNLSQDHLDYHETMEAYKTAKGLLFSSLDKTKHQVSVLNVDDVTFPYYQQINNGECLTYGITEEADIQAFNISYEDGLSFEMHYKGEIYFVRTRLVGHFHVYNLLAVIGLCLSDGWKMSDIIDSLYELSPVTGRMENIHCGQPYEVIVDYAHTPDGLENALRSIIPAPNGKILTIVGCGGNRDKTKRPQMARIAERYSDYVILTSDNPRFESPTDILEDMRQGMKGNAYEICADRETAILKGISSMKAGDVLLIAGKGHENYQIIGDTKIAFSDVETAKKAIQSQSIVR